MTWRLWLAVDVGRRNSKFIVFYFIYGTPSVRTSRRDVTSGHGSNNYASLVSASCPMSRPPHAVPSTYAYVRSRDSHPIPTHVPRKKTRLHPEQQQQRVRSSEPQHVPTLRPARRKPQLHPPPSSNSASVAGNCIPYPPCAQHTENHGCTPDW
jgi:hypothetical protein